MTADSSAPGRRRTRRIPAWKRRLRLFRRGVAAALPFVGVLSLVALIGACWVGARLLKVRGELNIAKSEAARLEADVRAGNAPNLTLRLDRIRQAAAAARGAADDPVVRLYSHSPIGGSTVSVARGIVFAVDGLARDVLPGLVDGAQAISPAERQRGATIDLAPFRAAAPRLAKAYAALVAIRARVGKLPLDAIHPVDDARGDLSRRLDRLVPLVRGADVAAQVVPAMLGGDATRRYFVAVQTNAEARATGGLIGSYGILSANKGTLRLDRAGPNNELVTLHAPVLDLGAEFNARYRPFSSDFFWQNANMTPHFPYVGRILTTLWDETEHQKLDGAIAVDPVALGYLLGATGPVTLSNGVRLDAKTAAPFLLSDVYQRYPDGGQRSTFLTETFRLIFDKIAASTYNPKTLAERLGRAVVEGHLQVYSTAAAEQTALETLTLAGALPTDRAPYLSVITQDAGGSKLDYYIRRSVTYTGKSTGQKVDVGLGQPVAEEAADVTVTLTNTAPKTGLPDYVVARGDPPGERPRVRGQSRTYVSVYLGVGATVGGATLDDERISIQSQTELGHSVVSTTVMIDPGQTVTLKLKVFQPAPAGSAFFYRPQPLAFPDEVVIRRG